MFTVRQGTAGCSGRYHLEWR